MIKHVGTYTILCRDGMFVIKNRLTDRALAEVFKPLIGQTPDIEIKYLALGMSDAPISDTSTALGNEVFRSAFTDTAVSGSMIRSTLVVLEEEAVVHIKEIGLFGGSSATMAANSGTLISRVLWDKVKTADESITIIRTDGIERG